MIRLLIAVAFVLAAPAGAAPISIERQFAPKSLLIDPRFDIHAPDSATTVDHGAWDRFLGAYVIESPAGINLVRYDAVAAGDRKALDDYISALESVDVAALSRPEQIAFWINLYNAATVRLILRNPGVKSIRDIRKPWDTATATVLGRALTLNEIEHGIIRPIAKDPRIHYAVNCASMGCPNLALEPFVGTELDAQLDAAARRYVNHPRGVRVDGGKAVLSKIYGWYRDDFGKDDAALFDHLRRYADPPLAEQLKGVSKASSYEYDWSLNAAP